MDLASQLRQAIAAIPATAKAVKVIKGLSDDQKKVLRVLGNKRLTCVQIAKASGIKVNNTHRCLLRLESLGNVNRDGEVFVDGSSKPSHIWVKVKQK